MRRNRTITILTAVIGAAILTFLFRFNLRNPFGEHYLLVNSMLLLWLPMLAIFFVAREEPSRFGFALGESWSAWWPTLLLFAGILVLEIPASRMAEFQRYYPLERETSYSWQAFLFSEAKWGMYFFCWEFFFRGFLLFGLQRAIGWWAVLVQAIAFGIMHWTKVPAEFILSFPAGIILGALALRARSFLPCFLLHWSAAVAFDLLVIWSR